MQSGSIRFVTIPQGKRRAVTRKCLVLLSHTQLSSHLLIQAYLVLTLVIERGRLVQSRRTRENRVIEEKRANQIHSRGEQEFTLKQRIETCLLSVDVREIAANSYQIGEEREREKEYNRFFYDLRKRSSRLFSSSRLSKRSTGLIHIVFASFRKAAYIYRFSRGVRERGAEVMRYIL